MQIFSISQWRPATILSKQRSASLISKIVLMFTQRTGKQNRNGIILICTIIRSLFFIRRNFKLFFRVRFNISSSAQIVSLDFIHPSVYGLHILEQTRSLPPYTIPKTKTKVIIPKRKISIFYGSNILYNCRKVNMGSKQMEKDTFTAPDTTPLCGQIRHQTETKNKFSLFPSVKA